MRLVTAAAFLCWFAQAMAQESGANRASRADGEQAYLRAGCHACHGTVGHGGAGPSLAPNTLPLTAFETWVRGGTPGWTVTSGMPAYPPDILSDEELADVRAYLAGLPAPRPVDDIRLFDD